MKKIILCLLVLTLQSNAFACANFEAQFFGNVTATIENEKKCAIFCELTYLNNHVFCPITAEKGDVVTINMVKRVGEKCPSVGQEISGVIQQLEDFYHWDR